MSGTISFRLFHKNIISSVINHNEMYETQLQTFRPLSIVPMYTTHIISIIIPIVFP